jgi:hypothetical protein
LDLLAAPFYLSERSTADGFHQVGHDQMNIQDLSRLPTVLVRGK